MWEYTEKVRDLFLHLKNAGEIEKLPKIIKGLRELSPFGR